MVVVRGACFIKCERVSEQNTRFVMRCYDYDYDYENGTFLKSTRFVVLIKE
jgi:hypothetical protein